MEGLDDLPMAEQFEKIKLAWGERRHLAIKSPTGSGKSIGLPLLLSREGLVKGRILVVQPRRVAARMLARRVSSLLGCQVGDRVGYQVRFDKKVTSATEIIYLTDGMLLQRFFSDPTLSREELIIFDEFHERSLQLDVALALAKRLCSDMRPSLRMIVTSATLDLDQVGEYLGDCGKVELRTRSFPVKVEYVSSAGREPIWKQVAEQLRKVMPRQEGDALVFMDGAYKIIRTVREIQGAAWSSGIEVRSLYGEMRIEEQDKALAPGRQRRIIVSTNIAETSLTVEGVTIVVDTGQAKKASYDFGRKVDVLLSEPISRSSAEQRTGRAGRTSEGLCVRMWTAAEHERRPEFETPEIRRVDLADIYLKLCSLEIDPGLFDWFEAPSVPSIEAARSLLLGIKALCGNGRMTQLGREASRYPLHPRMASSLLEARQRDCLSAVALTFAFLEDRGPLSTAVTAMDCTWMEGTDWDAESDLLIMLRAYLFARSARFSPNLCREEGIHALRCKDVERIASRLCSQVGMDEFEPSIPCREQYLKIMMSAYPENVCLLKSRGTNLYETIDGRRVHLSRHSRVGASTWVLPLRIIEKLVGGRVSLEMELVSVLEESWIRDFYGDQIKELEEVSLDLDTRKVSRTNYSKIGMQKFSIRKSHEVSERDVQTAYAEALYSGDLKLKNWNTEVTLFLSRIEFLHRHFPEYDIFPLDDASLKIIYQEICSGQKSWKAIRNQVVLPFLRAAYQPDQLATLDDAVPEQIDLGNGKRPYRIHYQPDEARISVYLQDLYDLSTHPAIIHGRHKLLIDILAPNGRSAQLTTDLPSFWDGSYPAIRKELAGRYPKHEWK